MKAQFVYENMNFERGQDTKTTIGVGLGPERMKAWERDLIDDYSGYYFLTKTQFKAILATLKKAGILKEIFYEYHSNINDATNYILKEYGMIADWPSIKDYKARSVLVDIDNLIGKNNHSHDPKNISLPKKIRFKKIDKKEDHIPYKDLFYAAGSNIQSSYITHILNEAKEKEVYEEYYKKNPDILSEFKKDPKRDRLYLPADLWSGAYGEDGNIHLETSSGGGYLLFRPGKNWVSDDKKQIAGCVNFYLEHPELWDYKDRDKYFQDLVEKEHNIEII